MADINSVSNIGAEGAMKALAAGLAQCEKMGVTINISVCDTGGNEVGFIRPDGAPLLSMTIARNKAYTVAAFNGVPTHDWFDMIKDEPALREGIVHTDRLVVFGGGVPIMVDGKLVGAVGCSGGSAEEDRQVAEAAAAAVTGA